MTFSKASGDLFVVTTNSDTKATIKKVDSFGEALDFLPSEVHGTSWISDLVVQDDGSILIWYSNINNDKNQ